MTVSEFVGKFALLYETFSKELQSLVNGCKQKTSEYSNEIAGLVLRISANVNNSEQIFYVYFTKNLLTNYGVVHLI